MTERVEKFANFLRDHNYNGVQAFNTRNIVGDKLALLYNEDGIYAEYCPGGDYLEIFGLTEDEFPEIVPEGVGECVDI